MKGGNWMRYMQQTIYRAEFTSIGAAVSRSAPTRL
jgi:hypothetical protein